MISKYIQSLPISDKMCWVFPGQGSQFPQMALDLIKDDNEVVELFKIAQKITNKDFIKILSNANEQELQKTSNSQLAIFLHSVASLIVCKNKKRLKFAPAYTAGHSLGELTALYISGYIALEDIIDMINIRSLSMQEACEKNDASLAAIVKINRSTIEQAIQGQNIWIANENAEGNVSIGGLNEDLLLIRPILEELGGRYLSLKVAGAFHTPLMQDALIGIEKTFNKKIIVESNIKLISNISGNILNKDEIIPELINQVVSPVEWLKTMKTINNTNIEQIIEFGPGKVLSNLCRRTLKDVDIVNIETIDDIKHQEIWNE